VSCRSQNDVSSEHESARKELIQSLPIDDGKDYFTSSSREFSVSLEDFFADPFSSFRSRERFISSSKTRLNGLGESVATQFGLTIVYMTGCLAITLALRMLMLQF